MSQIPIHFFFENIDYTLDNMGQVRTWLKTCILNENHRLSELNYIFCSDEYLLGLNQTYLSHNTYTDILTFDHSTKKLYVEGDIFISVERVRENAQIFKTSETDEMHRVMVHGVLHLCGMRDHTPTDKTNMRASEDLYLSKRPFR